MTYWRVFKGGQKYREKLESALSRVLLHTKAEKGEQIFRRRSRFKYQFETLLVIQIIHMVEGDNRRNTAVLFSVIPAVSFAFLKINLCFYAYNYT